MHAATYREIQVTCYICVKSIYNIHVKSTNGIHAKSVHNIPRNITVQLVCPGEFETPMTQALEGQRSAENIAITHTIPPMTLDRVADEVFAGIQRGPYLIVPGRIPRLLEWLNRTLPGLMRWALDSKLKKIYQGPK